MALIQAKADKLNLINGDFVQTPLATPVFLNSVPKCGTHLLRNIFRMFVPVSQQYHQAFIQLPILQQHRTAFDLAKPMLSWGHLLFTDDAAIATHGVRKLLIVRDPYDWVLARARFFVSENFQGELEHLKQGKVSMDQLLNMMVFGIYGKAPSLNDIYTHNAVAWLTREVKLVRYEELLQHVTQLDKGAARDYFSDLLAAGGMESLPDDWQQRVRIGADRQHSATARENLAGNPLDWPSQLPSLQRQMVDYAAPGLRSLLGYR